MVRTLLVILTSALLVAYGSTASAGTILARCGPSIGQSYYFEGGAVGPGKGGWRKDGFDDGRITILINDKDQVDIILKDFLGTRSYISEGYRINVQSVDKTTRSFIVYAAGNNFVETFLVKTNEYGDGTMVWTSSKTTQLFVKSSIMTAECGAQFTILPQ